MRKHPFNPVINVGKEGTVVFYAVGDTIRMRSYTKPKDPQTQKQLANRKLHRELNLISAQTKQLRQFCYKDIPSYKNSHNAFIGLHKQFVRLADLDAENIYQNIHWSAGNRVGVKSMSVLRDVHQCLLKWHPGSLNRASDKYSTAIWVMRNLTHGYWEWDLNAGIRIDGEAQLKVTPDSWQDEWLMWLFFYDPTIKKFTVDKQIYVPEGEVSVFKEYTPNNKTNWDMFEWIVEDVVMTRMNKGR